MRKRKANKMKPSSSAAAGEAPSADTSRKKKRQKQQQKKPGVDEATRIRISQILEQFRASNDEVYTFEANLTNQERAVAHELSKKMGMTSKSSGRGNKRQLSIFKSKKKNIVKEKEKLARFTFSEEAKVVLQDMFTQFPPGNGDQSDNLAGIDAGKCDKKQLREGIFSKPKMGREEIAKKLESLTSRIDNDPELQQIAEARARLPIASFRDAVTSTIESNQVVLISGETGCGKTTQVPQFLLDYMWGKGEVCKIVCTQPRRISATSVAERISSERGENVGDSVGYKIRLESKGGKNSSIIFCTNGVLLRMLVSKGNITSKADTSQKSAKDVLSNITHIIVDEIHERDRYSDFMLAILRDLLPYYPSLRLVLMSATLDAERFSKYFGGCSIIRVPGFTHPVKTFYLEDALKFLKEKGNNHLDCTSQDTSDVPELTEEYKSAFDEAIDLAWVDDELDTLQDMLSSGGTPNIFNYQHSTTGVTPLMVFAKKGKLEYVCMLLSFGADHNLRANDGTTALEWAERENQKEISEIIRKKHVCATSDEEQETLDQYLSTTNPEMVDIVLIEQLLRKICKDSEEGAILVFLPGWDEINKTKELLLMSPLFRQSSKFLIIALHSMVPSWEQKKVFQRAPHGCRKIILSTNIAETAITIDDVVYVIDSGRMKEKNYDPYNNVLTLQSSWVSKASAKQREGRAGRCQPGICYHLYSKVRAASLPDFQVPEIKRIPIEELCLQVKLLDPNCKIEDFLSKTLDPPVYETIRNATLVLQDIGALSSDNELTDLGIKLGCLPVHPLISKMLFFAILLNCLDPALTLACASEYRDPFTLPMLPNDKKKANAAKAELGSLYGGNSDQLAVVAAFECWKNAKNRGEEARFCSQYFVSPSIMNMLFGMRNQLKNELIRHGFIPDEPSSCSFNANNPGVIQAILVSGLYPMVGRLLPPIKNKKGPMMETAGGDKVRLHPHSINFKLTDTESKHRPLIIYDEITRGDGGLHIRNCSVIGPLPLLLLATEIAVAPIEENGDDDSDSDYEDDDEIEEDNSSSQNKPGKLKGAKIMSSPDNAVKVVIDRWLPYESTALDVAQVYCLRERLAAATLFKVRRPRKVLPESLGASMQAIASALSYDGLPEIVPVDSMDYLISRVDETEIGQSKLDIMDVPGHNQNNFLKSLFNNEPNHNSLRPPSNPYHGRGRYRHPGFGSGSGQRVHFEPNHDNIQPPSHPYNGRGQNRPTGSGSGSGSGSVPRVQYEPNRNRFQPPSRPYHGNMPKPGVGSGSGPRVQFEPNHDRRPMSHSYNGRGKKRPTGTGSSSGTRVQFAPSGDSFTWPCGGS